VTAPVLLACPRDDGLPGLRAWCGHCECWHYHGADYGHRAAHCSRSGSPYAATGYILAPPGAVIAQEAR